MKETQNLLFYGLGLSTACCVLGLRQRGFTGEITVLEKESCPDVRKRWCTWGPLPQILRELTTRKWEYGSVRLEEQLKRIHFPDSSYTELKASTFWEYFLTTVQSDPKTQLLFDTPAESPTNQEDTRRILNRWKAGLLLDSVPLPLPASSYQQQFFGYVVKTNEKRFDSECLQLMHFESAPADSIAFIYCLPYTDTTALVEYTVFRSGKFQPEILKQRLHQVLEEKFDFDANAFTQLESEQGCLPMGCFPHKKPHSGYWPIGVASGAIRASSGYGLLKIVSQSQHYAEQILQGNKYPRSIATNWIADFLDTQFLKILQKDSNLGKQALFAAATKSSSTAFVQFMRNEVTLPVALKIIWAMPKYKFLRSLAGF